MEKISKNWMAGIVMVAFMAVAGFGCGNKSKGNVEDAVVWEQ